MIGSIANYQCIVLSKQIQTITTLQLILGNNYCRDTFEKKYIYKLDKKLTKFNKKTKYST